MSRYELLYLNRFRQSRLLICQSFTLCLIVPTRHWADSTDRLRSFPIPSLFIYFYIILVPPVVLRPHYILGVSAAVPPLYSVVRFFHDPNF